MTDLPQCPECSRDLVYVKDYPFEADAGGTQLAVELGSEIFRCEEHGLWRVHQYGKVEPYRDTD